jgi:putative addiction module component (TIGR02574 family)
MSIPPFDIYRLTPQERLDLIGELWDSLSAEEVPLSRAQQAELDRRLTSFDDDRRAGIAWEDLDAELDRRSH